MVKILSALLPAIVVVPCLAGEVTIYRDTWGVPHVYADSAAAAAYGHGYAQAEDRLDDILAVYVSARGEAAAVFGERFVEQDYAARIARHGEIARGRYGDLSPEARELIESFVAGVRSYMRDHPEEVPAWARPPEPHDVVALYRAFAWKWPWSQARGDLRRAGSHAGGGLRSNQWVVGPSRSAQGVPIALIDPHLSWEPHNRFYEAHVHGGDLDFYGFSIIGTPIMALGHTDVLSLAATTGGPDSADIYEERIHPEDPLRYEYDGRWLSVEVEEVAIEVKTASGKRTEKRRIERTHHGPILKRDGERAYVARTAYDEEVGLFEQWLGMVKARNLGEFLSALRANQSLPQNIMYADVHGNTYYVRAGRVPVRPAGHRWDRPLPGWTSKTEWRGIHPLSDLVQILNPPNGFMQNCNVSPGTMMPNSPLTGERYRDYIYNTPTDRSNSRGRRAVALLGAEDKLTVETALRIAVDTLVDRADLWQRALVEAFGARGERFSTLGPAVELLSSWNRRTDVDNRGATLFRYWMRACRRAGIEEGTALLEALDQAVEDMKTRQGGIDVRWGDAHRARRGDRSWPIAGCRADGISTLRSVRLSDPDERGMSYAYGGSICTTLVVLGEGDVRSYSATPYGQSNHPDSPHYTDQGERLFGPGKLKPTWYGKAALLEHVESQRTLVFPVDD